MFPYQLIERMRKSLDANRGLPALPGAYMTLTEARNELSKYQDSQAVVYLSYIVNTVYFCLNEAVPLDIVEHYGCIFINYKNNISLIHYPPNRNETRYSICGSCYNFANFEIENIEEAEQVGRFISMVLELSDAKN